MIISNVVACSETILLRSVEKTAALDSQRLLKTSRCRTIDKWSLTSNLPVRSKKEDQLDQESRSRNKIRFDVFCAISSINSILTIRMCAKLELSQKKCCQKEMFSGILPLHASNLMQCHAIAFCAVQSSVLRVSWFSGFVDVAWYNQYDLWVVEWQIALQKLTDPCQWEQAEPNLKGLRQGVKCPWLFSCNLKLSELFVMLH